MTRLPCRALNGTPPPLPLDLNIPTDRAQARRDLVWGDHGFLRRRYGNFHHVGAGLFRGNQPSPERLEWLATLGIRTIINLRGPSEKGFYLLEREACDALGLRLIDYRMYSRDVHTVDAILGAKALFETIEYPAFMHCKSGSDRTGIMGTLFKHFHLGQPIAQAVEQLSFRYGHMKRGKTGMLDHFFATYLRREAETGIAFEDWLRTEYDPPAVKAAFMGEWKTTLIGRMTTEKVLKRE